jgi:hypothetical protein
MNTRMGYRYVDKTNCQQYTAIIVSGIITWEQITPYLVRQHSFIPAQIGLEDLQKRFALPGADQPWHQIEPEYIRPTEAPPTATFSAEELLLRFANATWDPNQRQRPAPMSEATIESRVPVRTPAEKISAGSHIYANDRLIPRAKAVVLAEPKSTPSTER